MVFHLLSIPVEYVMAIRTRRWRCSLVPAITAHLSPIAPICAERFTYVNAQRAPVRRMCVRTELSVVLLSFAPSLIYNRDLVSQYSNGKLPISCIVVKKKKENK